MRRLLLKKIQAGLLLGLALSPTPLWACAACYGKSDSPLASGMNCGILTLLGVLLTVLSGALIFIVHVIRGEEAATKDVSSDNPPES